MTGFCILLGVTPIFGAFVAGMIVGARGDNLTNPPPEAIKSFAFAFFIPVYFAIVGLKLDLIRSFEPMFFLLFLVFACGAKALSVYAGARFGPREPRRGLEPGGGHERPRRTGDRARLGGVRCQNRRREFLRHPGDAGDRDIALRGNLARPRGPLGPTVTVTRTATIAQLISVRV